MQVHNLKLLYHPLHTCTCLYVAARVIEHFEVMHLHKQAASTFSIQNMLRGSTIEKPTNTIINTCIIRELQYVQYYLSSLLAMELLSELA